MLGTYSLKSEGNLCFSAMIFQSALRNPTNFATNVSHHCMCLARLSSSCLHMLVFGQRARCLKFRKGEGVAGYFADLGDLYTTYHLWGKFLGIKWKSSPHFTIRNYSNQKWYLTVAFKLF